MTVHCPHCSTGYGLPDHLMGPRGARVRCPRCERRFEVLRPAPAETNGLATEDASRLADELLEALASRLGDSLEEARSRGRLLAEFGPELMGAFDEYRSRLGERGSSAAFREALKRWGLDL